MKSIGLFSTVLLVSGCMGIKVNVVDQAVRAPQALTVAPLTLDRYTPTQARHDRSIGEKETRLLADSVRASGAALAASAQNAAFTLGGKVTYAFVDEQAPFAYNANPFFPEVTRFHYRHYELDLQITDRAGRVVASAHAETEDPDTDALGRLMRNTLRRLLATKA